MIYLFGGLFIAVFGSLLHFAYNFFHKNKIVGLFASVNESTWEHIKLALTPYFFCSLIYGLFYGHMSNFFVSVLIGCLAIMIVIPLIFYGYNIITKMPILIIDILSFFIAVGFSQYLSYLVLFGRKLEYFYNYVSGVILLGIFMFYMMGTIWPPKNKLFLDPITKTYGINKNI